MGKSGLNVIALADKHRNPVWKPNCGQKATKLNTVRVLLR